MKQYQNLMFLKVLNAGHMVPMDVPVESLDMMRTFIQEGASFQSYSQNLGSQEESLDPSCPICPAVQDAVTCPACPACPVSSPDEDSSGDSSSLEKTTRHLAAPLATGLACLAFLAGCLVTRCTRGQSKKTPATFPTTSNDIELPSFRDEPGEDDDLDELNGDF